MAIRTYVHVLGALGVLGRACVGCTWCVGRIYGGCGNSCSLAMAERETASHLISEHLLNYLKLEVSTQQALAHTHAELQQNLYQWTLTFHHRLVKN